MELDDQQRVLTNIEICTQLLSEAPTEEIRSVLSTYSVTKDKTNIYSEIKAKPRVDVQATAQFLGLPTSGYNPTIAKAIIMKIDSHLLTTCAVCYKLYCISPEEKPLFSCKRCGQGCHHDCYQNLTPLPGIKFFCLDCDDSIPLHPITTETILADGHVNDDDDDDDDDDEDDDDDDEKADDNSHLDDTSTEAAAAHGNETMTSSANTTQATGSPTLPATPASNRITQTPHTVDFFPPNQEAYRQLQMRNTRSERESSPSHEDYNPMTDSQSRPTCNRYRRGVCPHGISGRSSINGRVCPYEHTKRCQKFCQHGLDSKLG